MPDGRPSVEARTGTWVLQAEAASRAGCSLSAVRKWRRSGAVAERMTTNASGQERVEVRLEDVLARVGQQPGEPRRAAASTDDGLPPPGMVMVALDDLEALFARIAEAERKVEQGEARLQVAEDEARFLFGRLAELRQQLEAERARPAPAPPPTPPVPAARPASQPQAPRARPAPARAPSDSRPPPPPRASTAPVQDDRAGRPDGIADLASELHRLYLELHSSRPSSKSSAGSLRRRKRALAAYDAALLKACEALDVPGRPSGPTLLDPERRTALSKALAAAGLDVRVPPSARRQEGAGPRPG